jgi:phage terminase Nu1 subunit (DNA packaging protein)
MSKSDKPQKFDALSAADVADILFVSEKTVRNWMNKNHLPSVDTGRGRELSWKAVLEWYVSYRATGDGNGGNEPPKKSNPTEIKPLEPVSSAQRRRAVAEADLKELELAERRAEVVSISDVERNVAAVAQGIKQKLLAVPNKLTPRLVSVDDKIRVRAILDAEMTAVCHELVTIGSKTAQRAERPAE